MLPNILDLAISYGFKPSEARKDGQVRISCPSKKTEDLVCYLNPQKNVYYCTCCKAGGGIKKFNAILNNKKVKLYGAATLNRKQLSKIGWERLKDSGRDFFKKYHRQVWDDWQKYQDERLEKLYALFLIAVHLEDKSAGAKIYEFIFDSIQESEIPNLSTSVFIDALVENKKFTWKISGEKIAKQAIIKCRQFGDSKNTVAAMLIIYDFHKVKDYLYPTEQFQFYSTKKFQYDIENFFHWEKYMYNTLVYTFALILLMLEETDKDVQVEIYRKVHIFLDRSLIKVEVSTLIEQYTMDFLYREDWAREGTRLARIAWRNAGDRPKHEFLNALFVNVKYLKPFIKKTNSEREKAI